jgi:hypothetical protein
VRGFGNVNNLNNKIFMKNFTNAKDSYNPNLEVFRTNETVRTLKEEKNAVILKNVAIFNLTDSEKEILSATIGIDSVNYKRISTMPHFEKEMNSLEETFFKPDSVKFDNNKLIHFFYARIGSERAVEKSIDNDGNNLTLVNLCFNKDVDIYKLKYDGSNPVVGQAMILNLDADMDKEGNPIPPVGVPEHTTESIAKKGILMKYI